MILEFLVGCGIIAALDTFGKRNDTHVRYGRDILGTRYKTTSGPCFRCGGSGAVHGQTCRKCGGTGRYRNRTWYR